MSPALVPAQGEGDIGAERMRILDALVGSPRRALFVTELALQLGIYEWPVDLDQALLGLRDERRILLVDHPAPDRHLVGTDLRIVAGPIDGTEDLRLMEQEAEAAWREWAVEFAQNHRCS